MYSLIAIILGTLTFAFLLVHFIAYWLVGKTIKQDVAEKLHSTASITVSSKPWLSFAPKENPLKAGMIFHPGGYVDPDAYTHLLSATAEQGILCVAIPGRFRIPILNRFAAAKVMAEHPSIEHWFIAGHSIGGVVCNLFLYGRNTPAIKGMILLGSFCIDRFSLADRQLATLSIYGTEDRLAHKFTRFEKNLPSPYQSMVIKGGNHGQFGSYTHHLHDNPALISREQQQDLTITAVTEFIASVLEQEH
ncbi:alpha/beta hydrolase [Oceanicoccus sagamiensis]|uniref:Alpha/beta hydrolase fold-5 domain-containing protein n=1 Tax=Oceanicoccus sagamiensis TaxID=716816 RepID=A0A1X9NGT8_9GAMM|nr:alpha/beta hydrolase [Oceanicoccus sagamiensis]ARN73223.1 hypothetical protein BST96_03340 [Oceanicoccus sagamiensis]